jgi:hypothetical protein
MTARHGAFVYVSPQVRQNDDDYEYLTNIDNSIHDTGYRLFCVFINKTDDAKAQREAKKRRVRLNYQSLEI